MNPRTTSELEAGLAHVRAAPPEVGSVVLLVRRPAVDAREILDEAVLDPAEGVVGDTWIERGSRRTPDGSAHPDMQLNVMSARAVALLADTPQQWALAGDQLYLDLDLSVENLPPGTRLRIGGATIEVTAEPHRGCAKFAARFGKDALRFVNSPEGTALRLRGLNARVITPGVVRPGDEVRKLAHPQG
jgi:hypothetical protein